MRILKETVVPVIVKNGEGYGHTLGMEDITHALREVYEVLRAQCEECHKSFKWNDAECLAKYSCRDGIAATMLRKILEVGE